MMLELLMTRQSELDKAMIKNCQGLKFIVLDELHTYRGRQGADVAMLMRRLRACWRSESSPDLHRHLGHDGEKALKTTAIKSLREWRHVFSEP